MLDHTTIFINNILYMNDGSDIIVSFHPIQLSLFVPYIPINRDFVLFFVKEVPVGMCIEKLHHDTRNERVKQKKKKKRE